MSHDDYPAVCGCKPPSLNGWQACSNYDFTIFTNSIIGSSTPKATPKPRDPAVNSKDWSANQYLKFRSQRTRPVHDLIAQIAPLISSPSPRIIDLGCVPGNSTQALLHAFPDAKITGLDASDDMLEKARGSVPGVIFVKGDMETFSVDDLPGASAGEEKGKLDLIFSNAAFHWLCSSTRLPTLARLFSSLSSGSVLAIQVPDNYHAPSHVAMRTTALMRDEIWSSFFSETKVGDISDPSRLDLDPIESPAAFHDALLPCAGDVQVWRTEYFHEIGDAWGIVEWVASTGLMPFLRKMEEGGHGSTTLH